MSLKYVHMIFVTAATLLSLGFAAWCFFSPDSPRTTAYGFAGVTAILFAMGAIVYGICVWKKLKKLHIE